MSKNSHEIDGVQRTILDNLSTAVLLLDSELCIQYLNPAGEQLFHISIKRALNLALNKIMFVESSMMERLLNSVSCLHPFAEHEVAITVNIDHTITIDYRVTPLHFPDQSPLLLIEISPIDRHLRIAREEKLLSEQDATRNVIRGMAHEIKNPLGGLRGAAQLLERELPSDTLKEYTQIIIGEADRLQNLVDRMLEPNNVPQKKAINIHQILEHVRQLVQAEGNEEIFFNLDYDPSLPEVLADPDLLIQAVLNITRNAISALDGQGEIIYKTRPQRRYTIGHTHHRLVLQLDIIDNGPGIDENIKEHIFFPMVTGRADGTGLGLSIAQTLINQHGGLIECSSRPGKTKFTIYLPLDANNV